MGVLPFALANQPELDELGLLYYQAFNVLSSSRTYGMSGALPITIGEITAYLWAFEFTDLDDRADMIVFVQRLDGAYLAEMAKRHDTETNVDVVDDSGLADNAGTGSKQ